MGHPLPFRLPVHNLLWHHAPSLTRVHGQLVGICRLRPYLLGTLQRQSDCALSQTIRSRLPDRSTSLSLE